MMIENLKVKIKKMTMIVPMTSLILSKKMMKLIRRDKRKD